MNKLVTNVHRRKFTNLGGSFDPTFINPDKCLYNVSNYVLNSRETFLLCLGLDFCLPVFHYPKKSMLLSMELLLNRLKQLPCLPSVTFGEVVSKTKDLVRQLPKLVYKNHTFIKKEDIATLKKLGKNKNLKICKPDKGNGVVIMNSTEYVQKMDDILKDNTKFKKCKDYENIHKHNLSMEDKINNFLKRIKKSDVINDDEYRYLYVSGSSPAILYGSPKVHKANMPLRPILAAFSTASYRLAKFIIPAFNPYVENEFTLKNSYAFMDVLKEKVFPTTAFLTSFDVTSLFTNIPIKETVDIAVELVFQNGNTFRDMARKDFRRMLEICTEDNHFLFNGEHYTQFEGFAMGNPLSATMANLFLSYHEQNWLRECPLDYKPLLYKRYVDDCFLVFKKESHAQRFLDYLNVKHPNIKFTMEKEENNSLNFLDCHIQKVPEGASFIKCLSSVFRKPTFTGLGMNFHSQTYFNFKLNNIRTLLYRAYNISSTWQSFHNEVKFLANFFLNNGYPKDLFHRICKRFIDKLYETKENVCTAKRMPFYHKIPFINNYTCDFIKNTYVKFLSDCYPQVDFKMVFYNNFKIQGLTKHKEKLPVPLESGIVYMYKCGDCNATYIGSSIKALFSRANEHFAISSRTGNLLVRPVASSIRDHITTCGSGRNLNSFSILDKHKDMLTLRISETIEIIERKPGLNVNGSSFPLFLM